MSDETKVVDDTTQAGAVDTATASNETKQAETTATAATTEAGDGKVADTGTGDASKPNWPDDWREQLAGEDDTFLRHLKRYSSPQSFAKGFKEREDLIRSGKVKRDMPDPADEKAVAEWRKEAGIPDDPTKYVFSDSVQKRMTDDDKPLMASFTEFAHAKNAPQQVVDIASEWYFEAMEKMEGERIQADNEAASVCEDSLRKDWAHGEYKANTTLAKRFIEAIPGVGTNWSEARMPDGRRLGDVPEFVMWAADQGRERFGDAVFANTDSERKHTARKDEIESVMKNDIDKYYRDGLDKEYAQIVEREQRRAK